MSDEPNRWPSYGAYLEGCRLTSKFGRSLTGAAKAAGMSPSFLHKIEGAEVVPTPRQFVALLRLYDTVPPVECACGRDLRVCDGSPNARRRAERAPQ